MYHLYIYIIYYVFVEACGRRFRLRNIILKHDEVHARDIRFLRIDFFGFYLKLKDTNMFLKCFLNLCMDY